MKRRILALFLSACLLAGIFPTAVLAVDYTGQSGVTPIGTTIDLFDYWVTAKGQDDTGDWLYTANDGTGSLRNEIFGGGINAGHSLKFAADGNGDGNRKNHINEYTGGTGPFTGIVADTLGNDGYPVVKAGLQLNETSTTVSAEAESLAYLFDPNNNESSNYKEVHENVGGLLTVDDNGYFSFDSNDTYASVDGNTFKLFTRANNASGARGFFPFNTASVNGYLNGNNDVITGTGNGALNHFFGVHMSTQFIHEHNGYTDENQTQAVTYTFTGDDDVWVFIDGVLVGDLGGIHGAATLSINFATGAILINGNTPERRNNQDVSTIKAAYTAAGKVNDVAWVGDTFANNTYHTLDFFYLERGGNESNMQLQYNLKEIPPTYIMKMDQDGRPIDNVHFDLYLANDTNTPIAHGTTDAEGQLVLTYAASQGAKANKLLSLQDLYTANPPADGGSLSLVLKESAASLTGYRKVDDISLRLEKKGDDYILLSNDVWTKGVYATSSVTVSAPKTVTFADGATLDGANTADLSATNAVGEKAGIMFGVILAWIGENGPTNDTIENQSNWVPVHGNDTKGWTIEDEDFQGTTSDSFVKNLSASLAEYYKENGSLDGYIYTFDVGSDGNWNSTIESLPGDINSYYFIATKSGGNGLSSVRFTTAYYYTTARTLDAISDSNTVRVASDSFDRDFAATVRVPNIKNYLIVQRLDETGKPVLDENGDAIPATFELYKANDITINADGSYTINDGATPYETAETRNYVKGANGTDANPDGDRFTMDNAAYFHKAANDGTVGAGLEEGVYYLIETKAPAGYTRNSTPVKVVVDEDGVHADAGVEDDGISTVVGVGSLVASMAQFGSVGEVDQTLTKITATKQVSETDPDENGAAWKNPAQTEAFPLQYSTRAALQYAIELDENYNPVKIDGVTDNAAVLVPDTYGFVSATGWNWIKVTQRDAKRDSGNANITELPDTDLTKLFSGTTTVRVASGPIGDLTISKTVVKQSEDNITTAALDETQKFSFDVALGFEYTPGDSIVETSADLEDIGLAGTYAYTVSNSETNAETKGTLTIQAKADGSGYSISGLKNADDTDNTTYFTDGKLQLADKESITITGLPVGTTYTVTEDKAEGYNATRVSVNGAEAINGLSANGEIESAAETDTLAFTNIYGDLHGLTVEYYLENTDPDSKVTEADDGSTLGQVYDEIAENDLWKIAVSETDVSDALHTAPKAITVDGKNYIIDAIRVDGDEDAVIATDATSASGTMPDTAVTVKLIYTLDEIGGTDGGGDGIPDKYQATVTYKIVGGSWTTDGTDTADKVEIFTLKVKDTATGKWEDTNPAPTLGNTIPEVGNATPDSTHTKPGTWDKTFDANTPVVADAVYTYSFDGVTYALGGITKEWVDGTNIQIPAGVDYELPEFENGSVVVPSEGVTLLYQITVTGEANAEFAVTDTGAKLASGDGITENSGTFTGTIPADADSVTFYVTKHFTATSITDDKLTNTATVASNDPSTTDPGDKDDEATTPATPADSVVTKAPVAKGDRVPGSINVGYTPVTKNGSDYEVTVSEDETSVTLLYAVTVTSNGKTNTTVTLQDPGAVYVGSTTGDFTVTPIYAADGIDEPVLPDIDGTETPVPDGTETEVPAPDEGTETPAPGETEESQEPDAEGTEEPAEGEDLSAQSIFYDSTPATTDTVEVKFNSAGTAVVYFTKTFQIGERFKNSVIVDGDENVDSPDVVVKEEERLGLSVTKSVNKRTAEVGDKLTYTITVKNKGNTVLSKIKVTDEMLGVEETIDTLNPGGTWTKSYTYTVKNSDAGDTIYNTAVAEAEDGTKATDTSSGTKITWPDDDDDDDDDDNSGGQGSTNLNTDDHYSYIIGYKDGYLKPYGTITRGEVATIFFRLLTDEARDKYWSQTNRYSDCSADLWCNNAISTLSNMGIIDGYEDGTFRPYGKITRAQFAKIAVGFFETTQREYAGYFTDIAPDAWYTNYVEAAARVGLIQGFEDGTFRPNTNITRAQACVIVNRALGRKPDEDHLLSERQMITWPDNNPGDWFYADMQEATNSHDYRWLSNGKEKQYMEQWTKKLEQRDWAALEHAWSTAHSAPGGEVVK